MEHHSFTLEENIEQEVNAPTKKSKIESDWVKDYTNEFTTFEIFKTRNEMVKWTSEIGKKNGLVIVIKTSDMGGIRGRRPRITFGCERGGYYRITPKETYGDPKKRRMTGTKKCGCPFSLKGKKLANDDDWCLKVECGVHNHPAADYLEGHSYAGRLSNEETSLLIDMSKSLVRPKEILTTLKQRDEHNVSTMKTIYNVRQRYRVVEKAGRSQMQQLLGYLSENRYIEWHRACENTDTVKDLFWTHPTAVDLLRTFPKVLIMDCTYKTNRYRLPLLEIVGVTSTDLTYTVAVSYLENEREENYIWALSHLCALLDGYEMPGVIVTDRELALMKAIDKVFPTSKHFLCRWHISRNIMAKCKKLFESKEKWDKFIMSWGILVLCSTEDEYMQHLQNLQKEFSTYHQAITYIIESWLTPYKDRFVAAWTDKCMHFGNLTSNRAESSHAKLKRQLGSSQGSFESCWTQIHSLLELQHTDIKASFEKSLIIVQHKFKHVEFKQLRGFISQTALELILAQSNRTNSVGIDSIACGCIIRHTYGLPCAHEIAEYRRDFRPIPLESVDSHWRKLSISPTYVCSKPALDLTCEPELELIGKRFRELDTSTQLHVLKKLREIACPQSTSLLEPEVKANTRGRPRAKIDTSTRRLPSSFELVASAQDSHSPLTSSQTTQKRRAKEKVRRTRGVPQSSYVDALPEGIRPYIRHIKDVVADGNCGYRAIADLLGYGEDGWLQVRKDLLRELNAHSQHYVQLYDDGPTRILELAHALSFFTGGAPLDRWMTIPDMGHLIASCYNVVLYHLSSVQCLTFCPLRSVALPSLSRREIAIGFVNNNHFVEVFLVSGHPVPPIAANWHLHHHPCASGWETAYALRIKEFKAIIGPEVATTEIINLDNDSD